MLKRQLYRAVFVVLAILMAFPLASAGAVAAASGTAGQPASGGDDVYVSPMGAEALTVRLALPDYQVTAVKRGDVDYQQIQVLAEDWTASGESGSPQLPERNLLLAVPPGGDVALEVLTPATEAVPGQYNLQPAPNAAVPDLESEAASLELTWKADVDAYAQDRWLPASQAEISEEGWLRGMRFVRLALRPFQYNPASGELRAAANMAVRLTFSGANASIANPAGPDPIFDDVLAATFPNFEQAQAWRVRPEPQPMPAMVAERLASDWMKITVNQDGLYRVSYEDLQAGGMDVAALNALDPRTLRLLDEQREQAIYVSGEGDLSFDPGDTVLFYGRRNTAYLSTDDNVYWLTWGGNNGLRMATQDGTPGSADFAETLLTTIHVENDNRFYVRQRPWANWPLPVDHDHWFWRSLAIDVPYGFTLGANTMAVDTTSTTSGTFTAYMIGAERFGEYQVSATINGQAVGDYNWSYPQNPEMVEQHLAISPGVLSDDSNVIQLTATTVGQSSYATWLDWLRITYPYNGLYLSTAIFHNPTPGIWRFQIRLVPDNTFWILNLADPMRPKRVINATAQLTSGKYRVTWQLETSADDQFLVLSESQVKQPAAIAPYAPSNFLDTSQQVDYLVISHPDFITDTQPLVAARQADGLTTLVVDVNEIYDEFSDGSLSAEAIKGYLAYAYANYQWPAPTYVLLVGDGTVDFRGYRYAAGSVHIANFIPPYVGAFDFWGGGTGISDNGLVTLQGNDLLPEMIIGRLPVNDAAETQLVVSKILDYANLSKSLDPWTLRTLWVADNADLGGNFHTETNNTIKYLAPGLTADRIYYCNPLVNAYCAPDPWIFTDPDVTRQAVHDDISDGYLMINWSGHGGEGVWAHERFLENSHVPTLTNADRLAFSVVSACSTAYFARFDGHGLEETMLRHPGGGIVGGFAPTTFDLLSSQSVLIQQFYDGLMRLRLTHVGLAITYGRARMVGILSYPYSSYTAVGHTLIGDPAMQLLQPNGDCAPGDLDCDVNYDVVDIQMVLAAWNTSPWQRNYNPRADLDGNRRIDVNDLLIAAGNWGDPVR